MEEIGKALKVIFDKLSDFFDIFDLSFFVSGVFSTGIVYGWITFRGFDQSSSLSSLPVIVVILICYIAGLTSFAVGRWLRTGVIGFIKKKYIRFRYKDFAFDRFFIKILKAHGLDQDSTIKDYLERSLYRGTWRLYVRLWAEVRATSDLTQSLSFLKRYWVMAATYDGLTFSFLLGILLIIEIQIDAGRTLSEGIPYFFGIISFFFIILIICLREANRFLEYQVEELVATVAAYRAKTK